MNSFAQDVAGDDFSNRDDGGNDVITITNSTIGRDVNLGGGNNSLTATNSVIDTDIDSNLGNNTINLTDVTGLRGIFLDDGNDTLMLVNTEVSTSIDLEDGDNVFTATGGSIGTRVTAEDGNDQITVTNVEELNFIDSGDGADVINITDTEISSSVTAGRNSNDDGVDMVTILRSDIGSNVALGEGNDVLVATDSRINGSVSSTGGDDTVILTNVVDVNNINISDGADTVVLDNTVLSGQLDVGVNGDTDGADNVTIRNNSDVGTSIDLGSQNDVLTASDSRINGSIFSSDGDDTVSLTNVIDVNSISIDEGADTVVLNNTTLSGTLDVGLNNDDDGADTVSVLNGSVIGGQLDTGFADDSVIITNSEIGGTVTLGDGNDTIVANNATIDQRIGGGDGNDMITVLNSDNTDLNFVVEGEGDDDVIVITNSTLDTILGDVNRTETTRDGNDTITITNSTIEREIRTTGGDDALTLNNVMVLNNGSMSGTSVDLGSGEDIIDFTGTINGSLELGADNDTLILNAGSVINSTSSSEVFGGSGDDTITINGGTFTQGISGGNDNDTLTLNAGTLGELDAGSGDDIVNLFGGTLTGANNANRFNAGSGDDTLIVDPTQSATALDLTGITVFDGDAGTDTATFRNVATGNQLIDNVSFTQWETVTFENSVVNIDDSNFIENISLVNSTLNQVDGDLNLSGGSTVLTADAGSTINLQDGATDDTIFAQLNANAGSRLAVDVDVMSRGFVAEDSDHIIGSSHTPEAGVNVNVNTIGNTSLSGSRRVVDGGADVADPGVGASVNASSTYLLENDPSTGARRFWLQDGEDGGVFLVWTTPVSSETASAFFGGGTLLAGTSALDADLAIDGDGVGAAANSVAANAGAFGAISNIANLAAPRTNIRSNNGPSRTRSADGKTYQSCAASGEDWNAWVSGGYATSEFGSSDADSRTVAVGVERDLNGLFESNCGRVAIGAFAYFGDSDTDADFGSNSEITSQGIGAYLRGSTQAGFYGALSAYIGENEIESFNAVLESDSDYDANAHGVAVTLGKSTQISQGLNLDLRGQAFWGVSNSDQFTDTIDVTVDAVDSNAVILTGTAGLDKNIGETTNIYGRAGVKYSDYDNELNAFGITVRSEPSFTTAIGEIGASKNFTNAFRGEIAGFGEIGSDVETYGVRGRLSVLF